MSCLYLVVRYFGLFLALLCGFWGGLLYMPESVTVRPKYVSRVKSQELLSSYHYSCYGLIVLIEWGFSVYFWFAEGM
ncbi:hypothetical protein F4604DRAFT_1764703, partial [Suillus subluteus]